MERAIRPIAIKCKNYLIVGSHDAAQRSAMIQSLFFTCKLNDIDPYFWLMDITIKNKQGNLLAGCIDEAQKQKSSIKELKGFAKGLRSDYAAVCNAILLPWSNGQAEGKINKLKTIKRQMYGRASFELLRKRIVLAEINST